jgi:trans-2-enoyl-CoA reductase
MGFIIRSLLNGPKQTTTWIVRRGYSTSDITASAMVYSNYGQPSEVLRLVQCILNDIIS